MFVCIVHTFSILCEPYATKIVVNCVNEDDTMKIMGERERRKNNNNENHKENKYVQIMVIESVIRAMRWVCDTQSDAQIGRASEREGRDTHTHTHKQKEKQ